MGTDIHMAVEVRKEGRWQAVEWPNKWYKRFDGEHPLSYSAYSDRNYDAFAILGNIRNGRGFAGVVTGAGFNSISSNRGVPADISPEAAAVLSNEHSASWVTFDEILQFDWTQTTVKQGWVGAKAFEEWERLKRWQPAPREYCGGISGAGIEHIPEAEMRQRLAVVEKSIEGFPRQAATNKFIQENKDTYCLVSWEEDYAEAAGSFWTVWMPRLLKLLQDSQVGPMEIRLVFDFDS